MIWVLATIMALVLLWSAAVRYGIDSLLKRQPRRRLGRVDWTDQGPTPLGDKKFTPQGLTWVNGKLIFANTWKDARSRVYEFEPASMQVQRTFDMPAEAVHTSGLAWDGERLWAVDHRSNLAYLLDLEGSLDSGVAHVLGRFDTTLKGTSACCIVPWNGRRCLAISDFMRSRRTILVRMEEALTSGTAEGHIEFTYRNDGLSQGLEYFDGYLYEAENKWGVDVINQISLDQLRLTPDARRATVRQYPAPSRGVEDLAWDGASLWTSDESVFRFFQGRLDTSSR